MSEHFAIGEIAIFRRWRGASVTGDSHAVRCDGQEVVVLSAPIHSPIDYVGDIGYQVRFQDGDVKTIGIVCLLKIRGDYDGLKAGEWDLCPYKPPIKQPVTHKV